MLKQGLVEKLFDGKLECIGLRTLYQYKEIQVEYSSLNDFIKAVAERHDVPNDIGDGYILRGQNHIQHVLISTSIVVQNYLIDCERQVKELYEKFEGGR